MKTHWIRRDFQVQEHWRKLLAFILVLSTTWSFGQPFGSYDRLRKVDGKWVDLAPLWSFYANERNNVRVPSMDQPWRRIHCELLQVLDEGLLVSNMLNRGETLLVRNYPRWQTMQKGRRFTVDGYRAGTHSYVTVLGDRSTVSVLDYGLLPTAEELQERQRASAIEQSRRVSQTKAQTGVKLVEAQMRIVEFQKKRAAEGSDTAQYELALRYLTGTGVDSDAQHGLRLLEAAAAQGHSKAQEQLNVERRISARLHPTTPSANSARTETTLDSAPKQPVRADESVPQPDPEPTVPDIQWRIDMKFNLAQAERARLVLSQCFTNQLREVVKRTLPILKPSTLDGFRGASLVDGDGASYLGGYQSFVANPDSPSDSSRTLRFVGVQDGQASFRLLQIAIQFGFGDDAKWNGDSEVALRKILRYVLPQLGVGAEQKAADWAWEAASGKQAPMFETVSKSPDRSSTDTTFKYSWRDFGQVTLVVEASDWALLNVNKVIKAPSKLGGGGVFVYIVPQAGKVFGHSGLLNGALKAAPPDLRERFAEVTGF